MTINRSIAVLLAVVFLGVATPACVASATDDPVPRDPSDEEVPDDTIFFDTVVSVNVDGTLVVSEPRAVTAGEQRAQNARRLAIERGEQLAPASIVGQDFSCLNDSLWLYSRTDWTGERICFRGPGYGNVQLASYWRYVLINGQPFRIGDWRIHRGGYWPGAAAGHIYALPASPFPPDAGVLPTWSMSWGGFGGRQIFDQPTPADRITLF